jgi:ADP-heptose:LPS heptosyltransferase
MRMPREEPEIVLDFQGLLRSGIVSRWRGSRPVIGLSDAREGARYFYSHIVPVNAGGHAVDRYLEMPRALGIQVNAEDVNFDLAEGNKPTGADLNWRESVVLHPWSRGEGKSLSEDSLAALCEALAPRSVILVGMHDGTKAPHACDGFEQSHESRGTRLDHATGRLGDQCGFRTDAHRRGGESPHVGDSYLE